MYLLAHYAPHFFADCDHIETTYYIESFEGKIRPFFITSKNRDLFPSLLFVSHMCQQGNFFSRINGDGIKNIFHNI